MFKYWLPTIQRDYETEENSLIIIGANGSGKSKLGAWIEDQNLGKVHRIGAQRNIYFERDIIVRSYETAENMVFYGADNTDSKAHRWGWGKRRTTQLLDDFGNVLSAMIALFNDDNAETAKQYQECFEKKYIPHKKRITIIDKLKSIWNDIFPHCEIILEKGKLYTINKKNGKKYDSNEMSDGERVALYLIAQVLCVPEDKILIIDEPELHLHGSIINRLWKQLEDFRPDCFFIYMTHDTQFAAMHGHAKKIWVKNFDGKNWDLDFVENQELPEQLLLGILGNRKNVLFIEGESGSYDSQLFEQLFPNYFIIPCGGCSKVIERTKAFKSTSILHHLNVFGIIDRDYRAEEELEALSSHGIYSLGVAEIENIFLVEELMNIIQEYLSCDDAVNKTKDFITNTKFKSLLNQQIYNATIAETKYRLTVAPLQGKSEEEISSSFFNAITDIQKAEIYRTKQKEYQAIYDVGNYKDILRVFNEKNLLMSIDKFFGLTQGKYSQLVLKLLRHESEAQKIKEALIPYLPAEIPN